MNRLLLSVGLSLAVGCYPDAPADTFIEDSWHDFDKDGLSEDDGDCNDGDPSISPSAPETCNGIDDDCDGEIDEGSVCGTTATETTTSSTTTTPTGTSSTKTTTKAVDTGKEGTDTGMPVETAPGLIVTSDIGGTYELWMVDETGALVEQLTFDAPSAKEDEGARAPRYSPDGKQLAFLYGLYTGARDSGDLMVLDLDTRKLTEVAADQPFLPPGPVWSADGSTIYITKNAESTEYQTYAYHVATGAESLVIEDVDGHPYSYINDLDEDGNIALVRTYDGGETAGGFYTVDLGDLSARALGVGLTGLEIGNATFAPDHERFAFYVNIGSGPGDLLQLGTIKGVESTLWELKDYSIEPSRRPMYSASGEQIYCDLVNPDGEWEIWTVDSDGKNATVFLADPGVNYEHPTVFHGG